MAISALSAIIPEEGKGREMNSEAEKGGKTLKGRIYQSMLEDILNGKYVPEEPFTEKELTEKYHISKSPIREALIELCNEGILRSIPRYGYEVLRIQQKDVMDAKEARIILECGALDAYFDKITPERVDYLLTILDAERPASEDILLHWDRNSRFHIALMDSYGNAFLSDTLRRSLILMKRAYAQYQYNKWQRLSFEGTATGHRELLATIKAGDRKEAVEKLRRDVASFDTSFLS